MKDAVAVALWPLPSQGDRDETKQGKCGLNNSDAHSLTLPSFLLSFLPCAPSTLYSSASLSAFSWRLRSDKATPAVPPLHLKKKARNQRLARVSRKRAEKTRAVSH